MIQIRELNTTDKIFFWEWINYRIRKQTGNCQLEFPYELIPATGLVAYTEEDELLAIALLYLERTSNVAVCGWCVANPGNHCKTSKKAIQKLLAQMPIYAKKFNAKCLLTTFGNRGINKILDETGFFAGEKAENKFLML